MLKGRLYAVSIVAGGALAQTSTLAVALSDAPNEGVWYNAEMLVKGDKIYVIGYRYGIKTTDGTSDTWYSARPRSRASGCRTESSERLKAIYMESSDYFSGRELREPSRRRKLVFYMPHLARREDLKARRQVAPLPALLPSERRRRHVHDEGAALLRDRRPLSRSSSRTLRSSTR